MPKQLVYQRLNKHPKHRWSMLRNMTASLFLHERIVTTDGKGKALLKVAHRMLSRAVKDSRWSQDKVFGLLRVRDANYKLYTDLINRFRLNNGSFVRLIHNYRHRKGDGANMVIVELLKNPHKDNENKQFKEIHDKIGMSFTNWEMFSRTNELKNYKEEKAKRDEVYKIIKDKIKSLKEANGKNYSEEDLKVALFGENLQILKLQRDASIPAQHYFHLYLKAAISESEMDKYYKKTDSYLKHCIVQAEEQINILKSVVENPKRAFNYEKRNFNNNYTQLKKETENYLKEKEKNASITAEINIYKKTLAKMRDQEMKSIVDQSELTKQIEHYMKKKGYNPFEPTKEQMDDVSNFQDLKIFEKEVQFHFLKEKEKQYADLLKNGIMTNKIKRKMDELKEEIKSLRENVKVFRPQVKGELPPINEQHYLTELEMNLNDVNEWRKLVSQESVKEIQDLESNVNNYQNLWKKREQYEEMLWRFFDRQVKKKNKPRLWTMKDASEELIELEKQRDEFEANEHKKISENVKNGKYH